MNSRKRLDEIIRGLELVSREFELLVVILLHPRTRKMAAQFGIEFDAVIVIEPLGFLESAA